jgi:hypothetical protein
VLLLALVLLAPDCCYRCYWLRDWCSPPWPQVVLVTGWWMGWVQVLLLLVAG